MSRTAAWDWARIRRLAPGVTQAAPLAPVTFPATPLVAQVLIALGANLSASPSTWLWQDITAYVRYESGITVTDGRADESSRVTPGSASLTLDNRDGRFSRRNPNGPYYGLLSMNTPIWISVDAGPGQRTIAQMFVNEWPTRWDPSGNDSTVSIRCAGILRRLGQGGEVQSALTRTIKSAGPLAQWPMEDGASSTLIASATANGAPMLIVGSLPPTFAAVTPPAGSRSLADFSGGTSTQWSVPPSVETSWQVGFIFKIPSILATFPVLAQWSGSVDIPLCQVTAGPVGSGGLGFVYYDRAGIAHALSSSIAVDDNIWHHVRVDASSTSFTFSIYLDGVFVAGTGATGLGVGNVTKGTLNPGRVGTISAFGHLAVFAPYTAAANVNPVAAMAGYVGEQAHTRAMRLCSEVGMSCTALASTSAALGVQPIDTLLNCLRDAELADGGVLYEIGWGLGFQALTERFNVPAALALDFAAGHIAAEPSPADDDQRVRNRWTVTRTNGSSATIEDSTSALGTGSGGTGVYEDSATINVQTDAQLPDQAAWRVRLGTVDEDRWPGLALDFAATPALIPTWTGLPYGARVTVATPPPQVAPDPINAFIEGRTQRIDPFSWTAAVNTTPASPYHVVALAGTTGDTNPFLGYLVPDTCVLAADATSGATTLSITSTGALWSTVADDYTPGIAIRVSGELMTVTAVAGAGNPQTLTVTRSVNGVVKAHTAGETLTLADPGVLGL